VAPFISLFVAYAYLLCKSFIVTYLLLIFLIIYLLAYLHTFEFSNFQAPLNITDIHYIFNVVMLMHLLTYVLTYLPTYVLI